MSHSENSSKPPAMPEHRVQWTRNIDIWVTFLGVILSGLFIGVAATFLKLGATLFSGMFFGAAALLGLCTMGYIGVLMPRQSRQLHEAYLKSLRRSVASAPTPIVITDTDGVILHANEMYQAVAGRDKPRLQDAIPDPAAHAQVKALAAGAVAGTAASMEFAIVQDNGSIRYYRATAYPFAASFEQAVWFLIDVTNLRKSVDEIGNQVSSLASFLDHIPVGFLSMREAGEMVFVNQTFAQWVGRSRKEILEHKLTLPEFVPAEPGNEQTLKLVREMKQIDGGSMTLRGRGGGTHFVEVTQTVFTETGTGEKYTRTIIRDVGQERATQNELRSAKEHFVNFFEKAPLGIALVDRGGRVMEANQAAIDLIERDGGNGRTLLQAVAEEDRGELARVLFTGGTEARSTVMECKLIGFPERFVQLYISRASGGENACIIYLHETTEQKNLELQFAQSQKMQAVGQLAGGIAHDFNNLLTAILGFSDLLLTRHAAGDPSFTDIMQVKQNANRAASLVRQLLAFSRQQRLNPTVLSITDVLAEVSHLIRRLIGENIDLSISNDRHLGQVKVDQGQLEQVIINLAVNARDAMPHGGTLSIRTKNVSAEESRELGHTLMPAADYVMIEVADTGTGIPKEVLGKIFEPFFTTKEVGQGTGLGLSTVYGIIKQTGGFVFPENRPEGGAAFRIYLPMHVEQVRPAEPVRGSAPEARSQVRDLTGRGTILLVEDEDAVRVFASRALQNKGYNVLEARSGEAALEIVNTHDGPIHLMVSDVVMPQMDGPTLLKFAREKRQDMKIIFISGYAENAFAKNLERMDFTFLPKPFSLKKLAETVKDVMSEEMV